MRWWLACLTFAAALGAELEDARDRQDRAALEKTIAAWSAPKPDDAAAHYRLALAWSYLAEVSEELRDRAQVKRAAEAGIRAAERAVALKPEVAEHHRILGTLCGQIIPANVIAALGYGKQAQESISRAIERDPKSDRAWVSRGVGNYYLPQALGGGYEKAIADFRRAIELNPKSDQAWLWLGLALRRTGNNAEARQALEKSLALNPRRVWTKQQLAKTPPGAQ